MLSSCNKKDDLAQNDSYFKTVDLHKALDFINQTEQAQKRSATQSYITSVVPEINYEAITNSNEQLAVIPVTTIHGFLNSKLALLEINGEVQSAVVSLNPFEHSTDTQFSGEILITDINGNFLKAFKLENNAIVSEYTDNTAQGGESSAILKRDSTNDTDGSCACPFKICDWCSLDEVVIETRVPSPPTPYVSISYMYPTGGGQNQGNCEVGCENNWNFGGGGIYGGEVLEEEIINELTGKEKCLHDLLTKNGTDFVRNLLKKFEGESEFDIKIQSKDKVVSQKTGEEVNGTTSPPINKVITISISTSKTNQHAALEGAKTILHEYIHADIFRKLNTKYTSSGDLDFKKTYEAYSDQHEAMGALYVNVMKNALKDFHKNVLTEDYNKYTTYYEEVPNDDFYEALAWRGLKEHDVKAWTDLSPEKKEEINNLSIRVDILTKEVNCID